MKSHKWLLKSYEYVHFFHSSTQHDSALHCRNKFACVTLVLVVTLPNSLNYPLSLLLPYHNFLTEFTASLVLTIVFWGVKVHFNCYSLKGFLVLCLLQSNSHKNSWCLSYLFHNQVSLLYLYSMHKR